MNHEQPSLFPEPRSAFAAGVDADDAELDGGGMSMVWN
jgi:hypothetical protein